MLLLHSRRTYRLRGGVWVTENGVATAGEETAEAAADAGGATALARGAYLGGHFGAVAGAAGAGDDVQGHCLRRRWTTGVWAYGKSRRFGLVWVDWAAAGRTRVCKPAFEWHHRVMAASALEIGRASCRERV